MRTTRTPRRSGTRPVSSSMRTSWRRPARSIGSSTSVRDTRRGDERGDPDRPAVLLPSGRDRDLRAEPGAGPRRAGSLPRRRAVPRPVRPRPATSGTLGPRLLGGGAPGLDPLAVSEMEPARDAEAAVEPPLPGGAPRDLPRSDPSRIAGPTVGRDRARPRLRGVPVGVQPHVADDVPD